MNDEQKPLSALIERRNVTLAKEARKAQSEADALAILAKHWPPKRQLTQVYHSSTMKVLGEVYCSARVDTRADALEYLKPFDFKPLVYLRGYGVSAIRVNDWIDETVKERYETEIDDIFPMFWRFSDNIKPLLIAYTVLDNLRVAIKISIDKDPAFRKVTYARDGRTMKEWLISNAPGGEVIKFAGTPESPGDVQVYFNREPGGGAPTIYELFIDPHRYTNIAWRAH